MPNCVGMGLSVDYCPLVLLSFLLSVQVWTTHSQLTQPKSGCSFLDNKNVFNIEILKGNHNAACPTSQDIDDQFKSTKNKLAEIAYEVMQLQTKILKLMDTNIQLTLEVQKLHDELRSTQEALQSQANVHVDCPIGYDAKSEELQSCYIFVARPFTWYNAETFCMATKGHLVAIESKKEQDFLISQIRANQDLPGFHIWIGANDLAHENEWIWTGSNQRVNYTAWTSYPIPGQGNVLQPDNRNGDENCVHLYHFLDYGWNDIKCTQQFYFICEYKLW